LEFKKNKAIDQEIGEYISALSNGACLHDMDKAYLVFGVENETHNIVGTSFSPKRAKVGNQDLEYWLVTQLTPRIDFKIYEFKDNGKKLHFL